MKKKIFFSIFILFLLNLIIVFYYFKQVNKVSPYKVANTGKIKIRTSPDVASENNVIVDFRLNEGDTVECNKRTFSKLEVRDKKGNLIGKDYWYYVKANNGIEGWAFGKYLDDASLYNGDNDLSIAEPVKYIPPPPTLFRPRVNLNESNNSWQAKVGKWWAKQTGDRNSKELQTLIRACDYFNPAVRDTAVIVASKNSGTFNLGQVCNIYDFCLKGEWNYVSDPAGREYVALASESLINGRVGDCDDYAVMIAAMITAIGGEILINYATDGNSGHAFTEVKLGNIDRNIVEEYLEARYNTSSFSGIRRDMEGNLWLDLDWFDKYPAGSPYPYQNGISFSIIREAYYPLDRNLYR